MYLLLFTFQYHVNLIKLSKPRMSLCELNFCSNTTPLYYAHRSLIENSVHLKLHIPLPSFSPYYTFLHLNSTICHNCLRSHFDNRH